MRCRRTREASREETIPAEMAKHLKRKYHCVCRWTSAKIILLDLGTIQSEITIEWTVERFQQNKNAPTTAVEPGPAQKRRGGGENQIITTHPRLGGSINCLTTFAHCREGFLFFHLILSRWCSVFGMRTTTLESSLSCSSFIASQSADRRGK